MIGELRLKVDGRQKELHAQTSRLEEARRFNEKFHQDLNAVVQVMEARSIASITVMRIPSPLPDIRRSSVCMVSVP